MIPITTCNKCSWVHRYIKYILFGEQQEKSIADFDPQLSTVPGRRITRGLYVIIYWSLSLSVSRGQTLVSISIGIASPIYRACLLKVVSLLYSLKILLAVLVMEYRQAAPFFNISQGSRYNGIEFYLLKSNNIDFYSLIYKRSHYLYIVL